MFDLNVMLKTSSLKKVMDIKLIKIFLSFFHGFQVFCNIYCTFFQRDIYLLEEEEDVEFLWMSLFILVVTSSIFRFCN